MRIQTTTETELSQITWDDPFILDCLNPILYQLPVWRNGFRKSLPSFFLSLKLIPNLQSAAQVFVKMLKDGVFRTIEVLNAKIHKIIHSVISFPPSLLDSSLFISYSQLLTVLSVYIIAIFSIGIVLDFFFFWMLICLVWSVSLLVFWQKWEICWWYLGLSFLLGSL